jgi:hypothetical protein
LKRFRGADQARQLTLTTLKHFRGTDQARQLTLTTVNLILA